MASFEDGGVSCREAEGRFPSDRLYTNSPHPVSLAMYCYSLEIQTYGAVGGIALYI